MSHVSFFFSPVLNIVSILFFGWKQERVIFYFISATFHSSIDYKFDFSYWNTQFIEFVISFNTSIASVFQISLFYSGVLWYLPALSTGKKFRSNFWELVFARNLCNLCICIRILSLSFSVFIFYIVKVGL